MERGGLPRLGHSGVLVCSKAGSVKLIHFVSKAQMACCRAEAPHSVSLEIMTPRQTALIAKCRTVPSACLLFDLFVSGF